VKGLTRSISVFGLIALFSIAAGSEYHAAVARASKFSVVGMMVCELGFVVAIFYLFTGLILLRKAHFWAGRAGPVQRLVTHARGRAYGFLAAIPCQLGLMIALLFAK